MMLPKAAQVELGRWGRGRGHWHRRGADLDATAAVRAVLQAGTFAGAPIMTQLWPSALCYKRHLRPQWGLSQGMTEAASGARWLLQVRRRESSALRSQHTARTLACVSFLTSGLTMCSAGSCKVSALSDSDRPTK